MVSTLRCAAMRAISMFHKLWGTKSQDSVHRPQLLKRKESRSGPSAYQPNASPLGHTGSHWDVPAKIRLFYMTWASSQYTGSDFSWGNPSVCKELPSVFSPSYTNARMSRLSVFSPNRTPMQRWALIVHQCKDEPPVVHYNAKMSRLPVFSPSNTLQCKDELSLEYWVLCALMQRWVVSYYLVLHTPMQRWAACLYSGLSVHHNARISCLLVFSSSYTDANDELPVT